MRAPGPAALGWAACRAEILRQHRFLQDWLRGAPPDTAEAFAPFAASHAPDFRLVDPGGTTLTRTGVLSRVRAAHGAVPGLVIRIADVELVAAQGPLAVAAFTETHLAARTETTRSATAVLHRDPTAPGGLAWLHLHETARTSPEP